MELNELPHSIIASRMDSEWKNNLRRYLTLNWVFPKLDGFVCISEPLAELARKHNETAKMITVPILSDWTEVEEVPHAEDAAHPFIFHAGTLTVEKDGILTVLEAFGKFHQNRTSPLRFEFSNKRTLPSVKSQMDAIIERYGVRDKVTFHNHLSKEALDRKFRECTMVIINKPNNLRNSYNFSTKLGECMSYHLPIITTAVGESARYLHHGRNALVIQDANDADEIAGHIAALVDHPERRADLGDQAAATARTHFHYSAHQAALYTYFQQL